MKKLYVYAAGIIAAIVVFSSAVVLTVVKFGNPFSSEPIDPGSLPAAVGSTQEEPTPSEPPPVQPLLYQYIEVMDGCGTNYEGTRVNVRSGPGEGYEVVQRLRTGVVLKVAGSVIVDGREWFKIAFDGEIRYPERVAGDWYVAADIVRLFYDDGDHFFEKGASASTTKRIVVDRSEQTIYAYDGDTLFMQTLISTGLEFTPTPRGTFTVFKMTPSRYMQGPLPGTSDQYYDLPGVPWNLYFTYDGAVIHGAYWHDSFGQRWSHGCVNLPPQKAKELYLWADIGTPVTVQD